MADLSIYKIKYTHVLRSWGNDVRFEAINEKTGHVWRDVLSFGKEEPDDKMVEKSLSEWLDVNERILIERAKEPPVVSPLFATTDQVETYLKAEGILKETETIATLKATLAAKVVI